MATLSIRNLPDEDHKALRRRATRHGVSMEAEARAILHCALLDASEANTIRRVPPASIAGKGKTLGDLVTPLVEAMDWECLDK
jgi:plasmid stability protein